MNRLDLIIDALEKLDNQAHVNDMDLIAEALAAARELQALQPVAWAAKSIHGGYEGLSFHESSLFDTPLYALELTK